MNIYNIRLPINNDLIIPSSRKSWDHAWGLSPQTVEVHYAVHSKSTSSALMEESVNNVYKHIDTSHTDIESNS